MIRHLKIALDTALNVRTQARVTLKTLLVMRRSLCVSGSSTSPQNHAHPRNPALRPGTLVSTIASAKMALRALANRWLMLDAEIKVREAVLEQLVRAQAPLRARLHQPRAVRTNSVTLSKCLSA